MVYLSEPFFGRAGPITVSPVFHADILHRFDILLPADYPRSPPKIYIKLPYPIMININLHPDGKVCLSLLGTHYAGDTTENWQPGISTILQCLLSIRAMILISNSLDQNAPVDMSTSPGQAASFDRGVQAQTIWFFMLNWLVDTVKRNGFWKSIVEKHFTARREAILCTVKRWAWQNPDLRHWSGHLAGDCVPKLGPMTEYIPGFHGRRTIDLVQQLEQHLPASKTA